jgi:muramidase (phage lysozyme)
MGADFNKQKFDPAFQDKLAIFDMRLRCRLDDWLDNKISDKAFLNLLANVWAGLPNTITGNSTYLGVLDNKAGVSTNVALNNLNKIKSA